jgi:hypothetical protein
MMALSDYSYQLSSTGVILNADAVSFPFVDVTKVGGLDSAPYRETIRDHEGADGGFIDAEFEQGRDLSVEGTVFATVGNIETFLDSLKANFAPVKTPIPFYFKPPGVNQRLLFVKPRGCRYDQDIAQRTGQTPIQFLMYAEDPRIYDDNLFSLVVAFGGIATTGFGFSFGFNLSFGAVVPPIGVNVFNGGNRATPAILTLAGPLVDPRIINDTSGKTLPFSITLEAGDVLVIDLLNRTVVLNGSTNKRASLLSSDWFLFDPGNTFIRFGGASGTGTLTVSYRYAWR